MVATPLNNYSLNNFQNKVLLRFEYNKILTNFACSLLEFYIKFNVAGNIFTLRSIGTTLSRKVTETSQQGCKICVEF